MKELELKIEIDPAAADRLARSPAVLRFGEAEPETRTLRTIYYDTPDLALARADLALRLRHDGTTWCQTAKARRALLAGVSEAEESTVPAEGPEPDIAAIPEAAIRDEILAALDGAALAAAYETEMTRTTRRLALPHLGTVELALDLGEVRGGGRAQPVAEAEIELLSGSPRTVFEAARHLFPEGGVRPALETKAERGARLAAGETLAPAPRTARPVALSADMTTEQGARAVLSECLDQIAANIAVCAVSDDPEGPHQLRVGLRRLRSAAAVFRRALGGPALSGLDREARWLGHEAGRVRDLDVALADILEPLAAEMPEEPGMARLAAALETHAGEARGALRAALSGRRAWAFLVDLGEFVAARGWLDPADWEQTARLARPLAESAAEALEARYAKVLKRGAKIAELDIEARHDLRKELKKLRYAVEFCSRLFPEKAVKPFVKRLKELQSVFGSLQDSAMAEGLFRAGDGPAAEEVAAARAAGIVIGVSSERARHDWEAAKGLWKSFKGADPFWR